jgi:hypothetical protein
MELLKKFEEESMNDDTDNLEDQSDDDDTAADLANRLQGIDLGQHLDSFINARCLIQ